jgi:hypothetical protein
MAEEAFESPEDVKGETYERIRFFWADETDERVFVVTAARFAANLVRPYPPYKFAVENATVQDETHPAPRTPAKSHKILS